MYVELYSQAAGDPFFISGKELAGVEGMEKKRILRGN